MNQDLIFIPVLSHMLLVFILYIRLGIEKSKAVKAGSVDLKKTALNTKAWPEHVVKVSNNIGNQFETPMLFYTLSVVFYLTSSVNVVTMFFMSIYALSRYIHAYIHVTTNYVPHRFKLFLVGILILLVMVIWQLLKLIF
jgi:hypothetical protein